MVDEFKAMVEKTRRATGAMAVTDNLSAPCSVIDG
jgi:hypothetical protein